MEEKSIMSGIRRAPMRYKIMAAHGLSVFVSGAPPEARLTLSEITISPGENVTFDASDSSGDDLIYSWHFHDNFILSMESLSHPEFIEHCYEKGKYATEHNQYDCSHSKIEIDIFDSDKISVGDYNED